MAAKSRLVLIANEAGDDLQKIWVYNAELRGTESASEYMAFLVERGIRPLADDAGLGREIEERPGIRFYVVKKRNRGHGHVIVFEVDDATVTVLRVFHTAQDWPSQV